MYVIFLILLISTAIVYNEIEIITSASKSEIYYRTVQCY